MIRDCSDNRAAVYQKKVMRIFLLIMFLSAALNSATADCVQLTAEMQDDMIIVRIDGLTFTCYRYSASQKYPYFYPVNGPLSGVSVTTESSLLTG